MRFETTGVRYTEHTFNVQEIEVLKADWESFAKKQIAYPGKSFSGKGIVYTAGGISYVTCAYIAISYLRKIGCCLPVEIWYKGNEVSAETMASFKHLNVDFRNFMDIGGTELTGYMLKPLAIIHSSFQEVLYLDADNNCLRDPSYLFDSAVYRHAGAVFWPDFWVTAKSNPIWKITGIKPDKHPEQESGQILIDKKKCWKALQLCLYFNKLSEFYYRILLGDKDTFKFAWLVTETSFHMIERGVATCGYIQAGSFYGSTMLQHDHEGEYLFLHRNLLKWDITFEGERCWKYIKYGNNGLKPKKIITKQGLSARYAIDFQGDVTVENCGREIIAMENECMAILKYWRSTQVYLDLFLHSHLTQNRYNPDTIFTLDGFRIISSAGSKLSHLYEKNRSGLNESS